MDNFFSSSRLFDDLDKRKINSCGTVWPNRKHMPCDFGPKQLKLKRSDVRVRTRGDLTALVWKGRWEVYMLTNMDPPPAERKFCDNSNCPVKPHIVERYNWHMGYVDNSDHMANNYLISRCTFKWNMKFFFYRLALTVLNRWMLLTSCGAKYTHRDIRLLLVGNFIEEAGKSQDHPTPRLVGRPSAATTNVVQLESHHNQPWPVKSSTQLCCLLCSCRSQKNGTVYKSVRCNMGLCMVPCFVEYHPHCECCVSL